ncbi:hypothetical protein [Muricoccus radiodurans]|uniref:hypothetical protein n=1 Tax=Muricoccus radiodurans TaxID=2231721 RepID=UPI003CEFFDFF
MDLLAFASGIAVQAGVVRFAVPAFDDHFAETVPASVRADPARFAFAAAGRAALLSLRRDLLVRSLAVGIPGRDDAAIRAAAAEIHPELRFVIWPSAEEAADRSHRIRCLLLEAGAVEPESLARLGTLPPPDDRHGTALVALLEPGERLPAHPAWAGATHLDLPGFTLAVRV